jgi:hypothetical protein
MAIVASLRSVSLANAAQRFGKHQVLLREDLHIYYAIIYGRKSNLLSLPKGR